MAHRQFFVFSCLLLAFSFSAKADDNLVELVKKTKPAVVLIQTFNDNNQPIAQGSGFFVNNKGHIVTNHHVLEGAYRATVKTSNGMEYPIEGIIARNADADIVKLVVKMPDANTPFLNLSDIVPSEGQDIVVIGNPLGLESTVSAGIVSAVRDIPAFGKIIQITAPISPGSSGSPVINNKGEVIGVATLIITKGQNLNFAIPSDKIIALKETAQTPIFDIFDVVAADFNDAQLFYRKGLKELWQENYVAALTFFQKAKEKNPQDANAWFQLGVCFDELGRWQEAIEADKQAIKIKPGFAEAHCNLGNAYRELGRYRDAIESYKQAIRIKPDDALAHSNLGVAYGNLGRYQDEIESYKQAIRINPDYALAHSNLGVAYGNLGRYQDEIESYKQAIRIKPDLALAHSNLGVAYGKLGRWQDAMESFKQAIRIKPDDADTHYNLGVTYANLNRYQDAIESYKQTVRINPDYAKAHYNLGIDYLIVGDKGSALEEYKILKTLDTELANKLFNLIYK
ncbi:MAG: tetratricopeptide repeat protein [Sedimentisphaerales bacterium]